VLPTLVLLPGLDGTGDFFAPLVEALGERIATRIVRYPLTGACDYQTCRAIARAALSTDGPHVLLGESFSGPISIEIAARAPAGLAGLILCASFVKNPRPLLGLLRPLLPILPLHNSPLAVSRALVLGRFSAPAVRVLHQQILMRLPAATLRSRLKAVIACDVRAALKSVRVPVLGLTARHDRLIPRAATRAIRQSAPSAQIVELDAPHCLLQCAPQAAADAILTFVRQLQHHACRGM
jgi:pimeloyl-ACP methyl ester carboxylesterase